MGLKRKALPLGPCCCLKSVCHQGKSRLSWQLPSPSARCKLNRGITAPKSPSYHSLCWHISTVLVQRGAACSIIPLWARGCRSYEERFYSAQRQGSWENTWKRSIGYLQKLWKDGFTASALQMLKKPHSLKHRIVRGFTCTFKGAGSVGSVHSFSWSLHSLWHVWTLGLKCPAATW